MKAIASSPTNGIYTVVIYYEIETSPRRDYTKPIIEIPCVSFEHAIAVADTFNKQH